MLMEKWDKRAFVVDEDEPEGHICYGGLYLSSTTDIYGIRACIFTF